MQKKSVHRLTISALLIAIGIMIPIVSPVKIILEPASFTLGSHVAIFIALFISPAIAVFVALGTAVGFMISGFPLIVALRALTHVIFALVGAFWVQRHPEIIEKPLKAQFFSFIIGVVHALAEVAVVSLFYFGGNVTDTYYNQGFLQSVFLMVGIGTVIHSMIDFGIASVIWKSLNRRKSFSTSITKVKN
ncbi:niacin transporter [Carnobacterium iners]|uniref:Niacin transporter n=1 Tax=Carnobacterium iners TaxID=1073423 RepID=A0A1X7NGQ3_9LACT|nr:hypothetical protein [Carnobacterium iners]SEK39783.1 niacin transporter [Carnobacterium iners]SMH36525.1 niacin transporter [Carnobacterium iners]